MTKDNYAAFTPAEVTRLWWFPVKVEIDKFNKYSLQLKG